MIKYNYNKLAGVNYFYDTDHFLNYFQYFGITEDDLAKVLKYLKNNEQNMEEVQEVLESKIKEKFDFFSKHVFINNQFKPIKDDELLHSSRAFMTSCLLLASRLIAQEYVLLSTVSKWNYNADLKVPKFNNDKFNYQIYQSSLKTYYENLTSWFYLFFKQDQEEYKYISNMDQYVENKYYNLAIYKDLFLLIWCHGIAKNSISFYRYYSKLSNKNNTKYPSIKFNVLEPINYKNLFILEDQRAEERKNARIYEMFNWIDPKAIEKIEDKQNEVFESINIFDNLSIQRYFTICQNIEESFIAFPVYKKDDYKISFISFLGSNFNLKVSVEEIEYILKSLELEKYNLEDSAVLYNKINTILYDKPILKFFVEKNEYLVAFPEIIWLSLKSKSNYLLFEDSLKSKIKQTLVEESRQVIKDQIKYISKKFEYVDAIDQKYIDHFNKKSQDRKINLFVDSIIYEKYLNKILFCFNYFYSPSVKEYSRYKNTIYTQNGNKIFLQKIIKSNFEQLQKQLRKIYRRLRIPADVKPAAVLIVNDILEMEPKIELEDFTLYITSYASFEYFVTSYLYRK